MLVVVAALLAALAGCSPIDGESGVGLQGPREAIGETAEESGEVQRKAIGNIDTSGCEKGAGRGACIAGLLGSLAARDPQQALAEYSAAVKDDPEASQQCHGAHHVLGEAAGKTLDIETLLEADPGTCGLGFIHGAIASYLGNIEKERTVEDGASICGTINTKTKNESLYNNCQHALGHRISINGASFESIIDFCKNDNQGGYESCLSGGYMEFFGREELQESHETWADLCNTLKDFTARSCWVALFARFSSSLEKTSPETVSEMCATASAAETCAKGAGEAYGLLFIDKQGGAVAHLVKACETMGRYTGTCLAGGAVIIHGAGVENILPLGDVESALRKDIPAQHREEVERAIEETEFTQGGSIRTDTPNTP